MQRGDGGIGHVAARIAQTEERKEAPGFVGVRLGIARHEVVAVRLPQVRVSGGQKEGVRVVDDTLQLRDSRR